jgi:RecA/RadA recombinase
MNALKCTVLPKKFEFRIVRTSIIIEDLVFAAYTIFMIQNTELLNETSKLEDLLNLEKRTKAFDERINSLPNQSVIALVGPFGVGKSTMLHQIMVSHSDEQQWIEFEAWKYPNRDHLWEGFVLDIAEQTGDIKKVKKQLAGKSGKSVVVDIGTDILSLVSDKFEGLQLLDKFTEFFKKSPATGVFDLQLILKALLENLPEDTFIIIEDIDRSGDAGVYFLETLKQFLKTIELKRKVIAIVPIANENYHKNIQSYLKSIDYFDFWENAPLNLTKFVDAVFKHEFFEGNERQGNGIEIWSGEKRRTQTISFLEGLFKEYPETNMRLIKLILRKADIVYKKQVEDGHSPDFRVTLCIEASKYYKTSSGSNETYFDMFKIRGAVIRGNIFNTLMETVLCNTNSIYLKRFNSNGEETLELLQSPKDFKFIERNGPNFPSYPWIPGGHGDQEYYGITAFYLDY